MIRVYKQELENKLKNVEIHTKILYFHNINREELNLMYKNFYEINNSFYPLSLEDLEVDNLCFSSYEQWLVRNEW